MTDPVMPAFDGWIHTESVFTMYAREITLYPGWVKYRRDMSVDHNRNRLPLSVMDPEIMPAEMIKLIRPEYLEPSA